MSLSKFWLETRKYLSTCYHSMTKGGNNDNNMIGLIGLINPGVFCYTNCIVQVLVCTKLFRDYVLHGCFEPHAADNSLIFSLHSVLTETQSNRNEPILISEFYQAIGRTFPIFSTNQQQDAMEFLECLIDHLHNTLPKEPVLIDSGLFKNEHKRSIQHWNETLLNRNSLLQELFCAQIKTKIKCVGCNAEKIRYENWWQTRLRVPNDKTVQHNLKMLLGQLTQPEYVEADCSPTCSHCEKRCPTTVQHIFQRLPKYLVFQLLRFEQTKKNKIQTMVNYPMNGLRMKKFCDKKATFRKSQYNLYAVVCHIGKLIQNGHYIAYCKHPETGVWYYCSDRTVLRVKKKTVHTSQAYLLFYELKN